MTERPQKIISNTEDKLYIENLLNILNDCNTAQTIGELLKVGKDNARAAGFQHMTYHQVPTIGNYSSAALSRYTSFGFPDGFLELYDRNFSNKVDPLIHYVLETGQPLWLSEVLKIDHFLKIGHDRLVRRTMELVGDGLAIPVYGPKLRRGYFFLAPGRSNSKATNLHKWAATTTASTVHTRYCTLTNQVAKTINLTMREIEVLELVVMGKTNPEIAIILDISKHTVNGYMKNLFLKFNTTDRVSTVIKALTHEVTV